MKSKGLRIDELDLSIREREWRASETSQRFQGGLDAAEQRHGPSAVFPVSAIPLLYFLPAPTIGSKTHISLWSLPS